MPILCCPTCGKEYDSERTEALPFCSHRCRLIDLGRWLMEEHTLPQAPPDDEAEQGPGQGVARLS